MNGPASHAPLFVEHRMYVFTGDEFILFYDPPRSSVVPIDRRTNQTRNNQPPQNHRYPGSLQGTHLEIDANYNSADRPHSGNIADKTDLQTVPPWVRL